MKGNLYVVDISLSTYLPHRVNAVFECSLSSMFLFPNFGVKYFFHQLLFILQALFTAWQNGALSKSYLQTTLEKLSTQMLDIESHHLAPPGWRAVWDRYALPSCYYFLFSLRLFVHFLCKKSKTRRLSKQAQS